MLSRMAWASGERVIDPVSTRLSSAGDHGNATHLDRPPAIPGLAEGRRPNPGRFRSYLIMLFAAQRGRGVLLWLGAMLFVHAAHAATPVSVQLVLAVDVSGSVSQDRFELQRAGYAAAFRDPAVAQAIRSTSTG